MYLIPWLNLAAAVVGILDGDILSIVLTHIERDVLLRRKHQQRHIRPAQLRHVNRIKTARTNLLKGHLTLTRLVRQHNVEAIGILLLGNLAPLAQQILILLLVLVRNTVRHQLQHIHLVRCQHFVHNILERLVQARPCRTPFPLGGDDVAALFGKQRDCVSIDLCNQSGLPGLRSRLPPFIQRLMLERNHHNLRAVVRNGLDILDDCTLHLLPDIRSRRAVAILGLALHRQGHIPEVGLANILHVPALGESQRETCQGGEGQQYSFHHLLVTLMLINLQSYIFFS